MVNDLSGFDGMWNSGMIRMETNWIFELLVKALMFGVPVSGKNSWFKT